MGGMSAPDGTPAGGWLAHHRLAALHVHRHRSSVAPPELGEHERVLIRESAPDGAERIGTRQALYVYPHDSVDPTWRRIGWPEVASVGWSRDTRTITLRTWPQQAEPAGRDLALSVKQRSRLPEFAAERVTSCRVVSRRVRISDECTATISAHRDPEHGRVSWTVLLDRERDPEDPALGPAIDDALVGLRSQFGC
jgi:hypothetical protein